MRSFEVPTVSDICNTISWKFSRHLEPLINNPHATTLNQFLTVRYDAEKAERDKYILKNGLIWCGIITYGIQCTLCTFENLENKY